MKRKGKRATKSEETSSTSNQQDENEPLESKNEDDAVEAKKRRVGKQNNVSPPNKKTETAEGEEDDDDEEEDNYEVEAILDEKTIKGVRHYLIRWKGYEPESDTWEPESTLNCEALIEKFHIQQKNKKTSKNNVKKNNIRKNNKKAASQNNKWNKNKEFEVESILDVNNKRNGKREFLVSWKGYPQSQNSWEPEENMKCIELINKFMLKIKKTKGTKKQSRVKRVHTNSSLGTKSSKQRSNKKK